MLAAFQTDARGDDSKKPSTKPAPPPVVQVQADGALLLKADGARIHGFKMHLENKPEPTLVFWISNTEYPEWPQAVAKKGTYSVELTYSCAPKAGGDFMVTAAANKIHGKTDNTPDWQTFKTQKLGNISVLNDNTTITLQCTGRLNFALMDVRSLKLTPVAEPGKEKK
jgi:hypothetical protein